MKDVGRHIADELVQTTSALNDLLARATRLVTLANVAMLERLAEAQGLSMPTAMEVNPLLTKLEIENIRARIWVHQIEDGSVVAGDKVSVLWDTIGHVPLVNVRLKNCMGVETSRGKTVQRMTIEAGRRVCARALSNVVALSVDVFISWYMCIQQMGVNKWMLSSMLA